MDDQFFAKLREIQRKERANSSLARVGNDFYQRTHEYLDSIRKVALDDPFSDENDLLKIVQRIATEICEARERKIASQAIMNIHRSYHLFQGKPQFDLVDTTPLNITEEEEVLYFSFMDVLKNHRRNISLDQLTSSDKVANDNIVDNNITNNIANDKIVNDNIDNDNQVLNELNKIKSAKIIEDEKYESIEKQVAKSKYHQNDANSNEQTNQTKPEIQTSDDLKNKKNTNIDNNINNSEVKNIKTNNVKANNINLNNAKDNSTKVNNAKYNSTKVNTAKDNNIVANNIKADNVKINNAENKTGIKPKSKVSKGIANDDEQFVDLDSLNQDIPDDLKYNSPSRATSKSTANKIANVMILIFSEINSIIGVDKKVYGPFKPQDIVIMPDVNAEILVKNKKGRLISAGF